MGHAIIEYQYCPSLLTFCPTYNVPLVWPNLIAPRPTVQTSTRGPFIATAIPDNRRGDKPHEGGKSETETHLGGEKAFEVPDRNNRTRELAGTAGSKRQERSTSTKAGQRGFETLYKGFHLMTHEVDHRSRNKHKNQPWTIAGSLWHIHDTMHCNPAEALRTASQSALIYTPLSTIASQ